MFFTPKAIDPNAEQPHLAKQISTEAAQPEPQPELRLSSSIKTPEKSENEPPKGPFSLFGRMANSVRARNNHAEDDQPIYVLNEDKQVYPENDFVTEEMLNIPAYQRRK